MSSYYDDSARYTSGYNPRRVRFDTEIKSFFKEDNMGFKVGGRAGYVNGSWTQDVTTNDTITFDNFNFAFNADGTLNEIKENKTMTLYEVHTDKEDIFAHKLATNSKGEWVMETKGTGEVFSVDPKLVEEVRPYTIGVQFSSGTKIYHYLSEAGAVDEGEFYLIDQTISGDFAATNFSLVKVVKVDTKSNATVEFKHFGKLTLDK